MLGVENIHANYRQDLNGLRAVAIIGVVIFHLWPQFLPGGYKGVDVFFVISGFLITRQLMRQREKGAIYLKDFYLKRFFRIVPLMLFVGAVCVWVSSWTLLPNDLIAMVKSFFYSMALLSNYFYANTVSTDYFSQGADVVPLLHLWSLSIKGQFYLFWPFIIMTIAAKARNSNIRGLLIAVFIITLMMAGYLSWLTDGEAYYSSLARFFEFIAGGLGCYVGLKNGAPLTRKILAGSGLILIIVSFFNVASRSSVIDALVPVASTLLVILSGNGENNTSRILSVSAIKYIGVISFSIYLWHWPLIAYYHYLFGEIDGFSGVAIIIITLVLSTLSFYLIEERFRRPCYPIKNRMLIIALMFATATGMSLRIISRHGEVNINPIAYEHLYADYKKQVFSARYYAFNCERDTSFSPLMLSEERCVIGKKNADVNMLMIGDSNAAHFTGFLKAIAEHNNLAFRNFTQSGCPILDEALIDKVISRPYRHACHQYNHFIDKAISDYDVIFIGQNWQRYDGREFETSLKRLLDHFTALNKHVILALKIPRMTHFQNDCALKKLKAGYLKCGRFAQQKARDLTVNKKIVEVARHYNNVFVFDPGRYTCSHSFCYAWRENHQLYYDADHWSIAGSLWLGERAIADGQVPDYFTQAFFNNKKVEKRDTTKMGWDDLMSLIDNK